jgi:hypothetical protein
MSSILTKRLPIAPPDQTERTPPKEMEEAEVDTPSAQDEAGAVKVEAVEAEEVEVEEALQAQEEDTTAKISCSVNILTPSPEIAQRHESF